MPPSSVALRLPSQTPAMLHAANLGLSHLRVLPQEGPLIQITVNSRIEYSPAAVAAFASPRFHPSEPSHPNWWRGENGNAHEPRYIVEDRICSAQYDSQLESGAVEGHSDDQGRGGSWASGTTAGQDSAGSETSRKRPSRDEDDDEQSKDMQRPSKRANIERAESDTSLKARRLACPYQKFDPEGEPFCGQQKAGNPQGGFHTVSRIK